MWHTFLQFVSRRKKKRNDNNKREKKKENRKIRVCLQTLNANRIERISIHITVVHGMRMFLYSIVFHFTHCCIARWGWCLFGRSITISPILCEHSGAVVVCFNFQSSRYEHLHCVDGTLWKLFGCCKRISWLWVVLQTSILCLLPFGLVRIFRFEFDLKIYISIRLRHRCITAYQRYSTNEHCCE